MSATVHIEREVGTAGSTTKTNIDGINTRANAADAHTTADTASPVTIPASGTNYSYWVSTRLNANTAPSGTINNVKWYTDGANNFGTGITCKAQNANAGANAGYRIAAGVTGNGTQLTTGNHTGLTGSPVDAFTFTSGSPKALTASTTTTGQFGDYMVYQLELGTTVTPGASAQETFTWQYDET